jgi:ADP-heptose:LPS heptosyltransferase
VLIEVRAPDHLGDGVLALPAIAAMLGLGRLWIRGPRWCAELYAGLGDLGPCPERPDLALLFKPSWSAAWQARRARRRMGLHGDGRWWLLSEAVLPSGGHRWEDYAALVEAAGGARPGLPSWPCKPDPLPAGAVLLLPGTASPETAAWRGHRALADALLLRGRPVYFLAGRGEEERLAPIAGPHPLLPARDLAGTAALCAGASAVVGNDAGLSHLAAAALRGAGRSPADLHVVYGSTAAERTGPPGATHHRAPALACQPCYRKRCPWSAPCLEGRVEAVLGALMGEAAVGRA